MTRPLTGASSPAAGKQRRRARRATRAGLALLLLAAPAGAQTASPPAPPRQQVAIGYVEVRDDPRYEPVRAYERLILKTRDHPFAGAQIGIDEAAALVRVLNTTFVLERMTVAQPSEVAAAVAQARDERGIHFFLVDAPAEAFKPLAAAMSGRDVLMFNVSAEDDGLRRDLCAREVVHVIPSLAMRMDALAQYLTSKKWRDILVMEGPLPADAVMAKAFMRSAQKFGARIVADQHFKAGTDPREREQNDPALLSTMRSYDVVFVADAAFDFARQIPYHTVLPRPVVGSIDLEAVAWHWTWEHNGAPQVNARFDRKSGGRRMEGADWAAWMAVKMVVQAALRTRSADFAMQRDFILGDAGFDGDKGLPVSVRPWDHQVRQAVLLAAPYMVVASAPLEGFLHRTNELDTLGDDDAETPCHINR
ncbi:MAG: amino acid ABC transporter substrate-binding protein [Bradyrhizobiaceae bacterium]|nr:amino acid ABC transporter substrate-binding protein [Bradyrhizobiaceae bacterium]